MTLPTGDEYTDAWYRKQFRGVEHWLARVCAEEAEHSEQVKQLRAELAKCREERAKDVAKLGELQSMIGQLQERMDKMSEWAKTKGK
jgi:septal ring factor EnvC (AmiA/AmiB activator)